MAEAHESTLWKYTSGKCRCDQCKALWAAHAREYRTRPGRKEARSRYYEEVEHPRSFGVTREFLDQLREQQGGRCAICRETTKLVVDHCHASAKVRGLLCNPCNIALGGFRDDPELLSRASEYLAEHS